MTEGQAASLLRAAAATTPAAGYTRVVTITSRPGQGATHAAAADDTIACGTWLRPAATITEVSQDLATATCRSCRIALGLDSAAPGNQRLEALFVLSITLGLRPGELRALTWDHVDLNEGVIHIWKSARRDGDTKTPRSRRSLQLPRTAAAALRNHRELQDAERAAAGPAWQDHHLVFCHENGRPYDRDGLNWRFSKLTRQAGLGHWHPHEARHTAVSIMSKNGVEIQDISDTLGHKSTHVTETVYRKVIVPKIRGGATIMDNVFGQPNADRKPPEREDPEAG